MTGRRIQIWPVLGDLDWWWLLLAGIPEELVRRLFHVPPWIPRLTLIWCLVQAAWLKKADPRSNALYLYAAATATQMLAAIPVQSQLELHLLITSRWLSLAAWLIGIFVFRDEMRKHFTAIDPRELELSGVMTLFFSTLYFQYWFHQLYVEQTDSSLSLTSGRTQV